MDKVLQLLIVSPRARGAERTRLARALVESLRSGNVDVRVRVHPTLEYLARKWGLPPPDPELAQWKPSEGDSITKLERRIEQWHAVFRASPGVKPPAAAPGGTAYDPAASGSPAGGGTAAP